MYDTGKFSAPYHTYLRKDAYSIQYKTKLLQWTGLQVFIVFFYPEQEWLHPGKQRFALKSTTFSCITATAYRYLFLANGPFKLKILGITPSADVSASLVFTSRLIFSILWLESTQFIGTLFSFSGCGMLTPEL
jgi:hypothetical protein